MAQSRTIHLMVDDYAQRLDNLWRACQAARKDADDGFGILGESDAYEQLAAEYDTLKAEAEAAGLKVVLRDPGRRKFRKLREDHPPRTVAADGVDDETAALDRLARMNVESAEDDLVHVSLVEPAFTSRAAFDEWADERGEGEWQVLVTAAWELANRPGFDPKSLPPSRTRTSAAN